MRGQQQPVMPVIRLHRYTSSRQLQAGGQFGRLNVWHPSMSMKSSTYMPSGMSIFPKSRPYFYDAMMATTRGVKHNVGSTMLQLQGIRLPRETRPNVMNPCFIVHHCRGGRWRRTIRICFRKGALHHVDHHGLLTWKIKYPELEINAYKFVELEIDNYSGKFHKKRWDVSDSPILCRSRRGSVPLLAFLAIGSIWRAAPDSGSTTARGTILNSTGLSVLY